MKCIKKDGVIQRVSNERAVGMVKAGGVYVAKKEWKATGDRSVELPVAATPKPKKDKKIKKAKKEQAETNEQVG